MTDKPDSVNFEVGETVHVDPEALLERGEIVPTEPPPPSPATHTIVGVDRARGEISVERSYRDPHPSVPVPETLPGYLDAATLRWMAQQLEGKVSFFRKKALAHPKNPIYQLRLKEEREEQWWIENVAARMDLVRETEGSDLAG